jgi:tetratricopeptide (TPR) repeat protein
VKIIRKQQQIIIIMENRGVSLCYLLEVTKSLKPKATMKDFVEQVIKPLTKEKQESLIELLNRTQPEKTKKVADHFVSYVWSYEVVNDLLAALKYNVLDKLRQQDVFIWLDAVCVNQHFETKFTPQQLQQTFGESLKIIGSVVLVLVNWQDPQYTKRIWCVFEAFMTKKSNAKVILAMSEKEEESLVQAMIGSKVGPTFLQKLFSSVDVETAKAQESADEEAILQIIREYGVADVNAVILGNLKSWIVQGGDIALKSVGENSEEAGSICLARRAVHEVLGEYETSLEWAEKALNIYIKMYGPEHQQVATAYNSKVMCLQILGRLDEALVAIELALAIRIKLLGVDDQKTIDSHSWKATLLQAQGKLEEALIIHGEVVESRNRVFLGKDHPQTVKALNCKGNCLRELKRYDEALLLFEQAIISSKRLFHDNHASVAVSLNNKAMCLQDMNCLEDAIPLYDQAIAIHMKIYGGEHPETANFLFSKAQCLHKLERIREAKILEKQSLEIRRRVLGLVFLVILIHTIIT